MFSKPENRGFKTWSIIQGRKIINQCMIIKPYRPRLVAADAPMGAPFGESCFSEKIVTQILRHVAGLHVRFLVMRI